MRAVDFEHQNVEYYKTRVCVASSAIIVLSFSWGYGAWSWGASIANK